MSKRGDSESKQNPLPDGGEAHDVEPSRWELLRDVAAFQVKLAIDGLRDLLLSPLSLMAGLIGGLLLGDRKMFYRLVHLGRRSERWINLFGAADRMPDSDHPANEHDHHDAGPAREGSSTDTPTDGLPMQLPATRTSPRRASGLDDIFAKVEGLMAEQVRQGGLTATAKQTIDRALNAMESQNEVVKARELLGPGSPRNVVRPAQAPEAAKDAKGPPESD